MTLAATAVSTTRTERRATTLMVLVLIAALLPSLTYLGHWEQLAPPDAVTVHLPHHQPSESDGNHANHCHEGAAGCAEQPVPSSADLLLAGIEISRFDPPTVATPPVQERAPAGLQLAPLTPPPRAA